MKVDKYLTGPMATNEKPPSCFFGCCDVRTWTLFVSFLNIGFLVIQLFNVFKPNEKLLVVIYYAILYATMIFLNVELGRGVLRRNIGPVLNWLRVYTIGIILMNALLTAGLILIVNDDDLYSYTAGKQIKENTLSIIISILSFDVIFIVVHYPVYQYYKFQRGCARQGFTPEKCQTV